METAEMETAEMDRFICKYFNIHWHEMIGSSNNEKSKTPLIHCSCGARLLFIEWPRHEKYNNPRFEEEAGRVQLMKLLDKHGRLDEIVNGMAKYRSTVPVPTGWVPSEWVTDDYGKLRDYVFIVLDREGRTNESA